MFVKACKIGTEKLKLSILIPDLVILQDILKVDVIQKKI